MSTSTQRAGAVGGDVVVLAFLIADIRGYSRFASVHGDVAAAALATRFADLARDGVAARGGSVVELRGDEVFATFATAGQAVQAGVELQLSCVEDSEDDPSLPLLVGIGIDVGAGVPVEDGYRGNAINLAARLCSAAGAGQVLLTAAAAEQSYSVRGEVELSSRGTSMFKGFDKPVRVVEARARAHPVPVEKGPAGEQGPAAGGGPVPPELVDATPLIGRTQEMQWLRGTWRQVRRGQGRVVVVDGLAGIGKTRLAGELAAHVQGFGGVVRYAGPGGVAAASALAAVSAARSADTPSLVVIDQLDVHGREVVDAIEEAAADIAARPVLLVLLARDAAVSPALAGLVEGCSSTGGHRRLTALDPVEVAEIVAVYAGDAIGEAPVESIVRASHGIPSLVHEQASAWARSEATRRLAAAAGFMAAARERRSADLEFANNVIGLKLGHLYAPEGVPLPPDVEALGPYKGLASFEQEDAAWFFGREQLVGELAARIAAGGALAVLGASGSGKTSLLAAGLLPSLRAGLLPGSARWSQAQLRPGQTPMATLREVLATSADDPIAAAIGRLAEGGRLVLVIDQFEELFTACGDETERGAFLHLLATHAAGDAEQFALIISVRSDFYGHLADYPTLAGLLVDNHVLVGSLSRADLQRVIQLPAQRAGVRIETGLIDALVEEAAGQPGALPLLSTALVELWQTRSDGWIRGAAYHDSGGIRGAVARLAEASYAHLDHSEQDAARRVLLRLASTAEGDTDTRRRVDLAEFDLDRDTAAGRVIERFTTDRLLTISGTTIEVAHEALLREWPRLRGWLDDDVQGRQLHQHLTLAANGWDTAGREPSELYRGARLNATLDWAGTHTADLNDLEHTFLTASREASQAEADKARRSNRRLRRIAIALAAVVVLAAAGGLIALHERGSAQTQARHAKAVALTADARRLAALSANAPDIATSSLLAVAAYRLQDSADIRGALLDAVERSQSALWRVAFSHRPQRIAATPDGSRLAINDNRTQTTITVMDPRTQKSVATMAAGDNRGQVVGITSDGSEVITFGPTNAANPVGRLALYAVPSGREDVIFDGGDVDAPQPVVSPDGRWIAIITTKHAGAKVSVDIFDTANPDAPPRSFTTIAPIALAAGRSVLALESPDGSVQVRSLPALRPIGGVPPIPSASPGGVGGLAVSPDGSTVARVDLTTPNNVGVYRLTPRARTAIALPAQPTAVNTMAFAPDGSELAVGSVTGSLNVYQTRNGRQAASLAGHAGQVMGIAWSGTSVRTHLYSVGLDGQLISWDFGTGPRLVTQSGPDRYPPGPNRAVLSGSLVIGGFQPPGATNSHRQLFTVDASTGAYASWPAGLHDDEGIGQIAASRNGHLALVSITGIYPGADEAHNRVAIVDLRSHRTIGHLALPGTTVSADGYVAAISPDARLAYCSIGRSRIGVFALPSGRYLRSFAPAFADPDAGRLEVFPWQFDPAGRLVVAMYDPGRYGAPWSKNYPPLPADQRLGLVDTASLKLVAQTRLGDIEGPTAVAWTHDGQTLALGTADGTVALYQAGSLTQQANAGIVSAGPVDTLGFTSDDQTLIVGGPELSFWSVPDLTREGQPIAIGDSETSGGVWAWGGPHGEVRGLAQDIRHPDAGYRWFTLDIDPNSLARTACRLAGSNMSPAEWRRYVGDQPYRNTCA